MRSIYIILMRDTKTFSCIFFPDTHESRPHECLEEAHEHMWCIYGLFHFPGTAANLFSLPYTVSFYKFSKNVEHRYK